MTGEQSRASIDHGRRQVFIFAGRSQGENSAEGITQDEFGQAFDPGFIQAFVGIEGRGDDGQQAAEVLGETVAWGFGLG